MHVKAMASLAYKRKYAQSTPIMLQHSRIVCVHVVVAAWMNRALQSAPGSQSINFLSLDPLDWQTAPA